MIKHTKKIIGKARPEDWELAERIVEEFYMCSTYELPLDFINLLSKESCDRKCLISELPKEIVLDIALEVAWELGWWGFSKSKYATYWNNDFWDYPDYCCPYECYEYLQDNWKRGEHLPFFPY